MDERIEKYPKTTQFRGKGTIGVPHPYVIGTRHVKYAADHCCGILTRTTIQDAEKYGHVRCCMKGCALTYEQHETALLIEVKDQRELQDIPELHGYLLSIKNMTEKDGFSGFAFIKG